MQIALSCHKVKGFRNIYACYIQYTAVYKVFLLTGNYHSKLVRSSAKYSLGLSCQSYFRRGDLFPLPLLPLFPSPCLANSLFIAISGIYQFQLKNSHGFGNGRARCLRFANTSRLLFLSLSLTARSIYQSVCASVSVSLCVCVCVQVEQKRHSPKITFPSLDYSTLHFVMPKRRSSIALKCSEKRATKTRSTYQQFPPHPLLCTSSSSHSC